MQIDFDKVFDTLVLWITSYSLKIVAAIIVFLVGKWIARKLTDISSRLLEKNNVDITLTKFLEGIIYYTLLVIVLIAAAGQLGIDTTSFLTILGMAGLAVGLALKDSLSNFASGVMLIAFRPFKVGDFVEAGGVSGTVISIDMFNTTIHSVDNKKVIVPNANITGNVITNVNANDTRRVDLVIGISYDDDIAAARKILESIVEKDKRILEDPAVTIAVSELADSSVNFVVRSWVNTPDYWDVYFDLTEKIKIIFDQEGITIPYPQQDVHLHPDNEK